MLNRRHLLQLSGLSLASAALPRFAFAEELDKPRYFVTIQLRGGIDAVWTLDPKTRAEVAAKVDVPYAANAIVDGAIPLGPHFAGLSPHTGEMALVRGLQTLAANHESGSRQLLRMRTAVNSKVPALYDIIGQTRSSQPLASVTMGQISSFEHSPGALAAPSGGRDSALDALDSLTDEEISILATTYKKHLARFPKWQKGATTDQTRDHVEQLSALFARLEKTPRFKKTRWGNLHKTTSHDLQRTLWMLENDISKGIFLKIFFDWDSHFFNEKKQRKSNLRLVPLLSRFLNELRSRKNQFGTLASQTVVVIGSELGRFPIMNGNGGKDHFPETSLMFFGPGINTGNAFVPTGKNLSGRKVSLTTGQPQDGGSGLYLDDVGTTMLRWAGVNPEIYGYSGRRLRFLERT